MTIERLNTNVDVREKIRLLNEMIMELSGKIDQAKFDKNEIDQLYTDLGWDRKYTRLTSLGHTTGTYTNWTHVKAETGYSIWKIAVTSYTHATTNQLYFDNILLENRGSATSESATTFDNVYVYDGVATYNNYTTEAGTEAGTSFNLMADTNDFLYVGEATTFGGIKFEFDTRGSGYTNEIQYWNGSAWTTLTDSGNTLEDGTSNFESDGLISYTIPGDWATTSVNSVTKYWIRIKTTATPVTTATAFYIVPADSAVALLAMSSEDIIEGNWAWCYYSNSVYVTIRNSGASTSEGNYYITSSSSSINLQNYFIYNHHYQIDYQDSTYSQTHKPFGTMFVATANRNINNSAVEATILGTGSGTLTIPASFLSVGRTIRVKVSGFFGTTGTPTLNIKAKFGSTTICSTGAVATSGTISNSHWSVEVDITCRTTGASGTVIGQGLFTYDNSTQAGKAVGMVATGTSTIDTTATQVIDITATWGTANASNTITSTNVSVEILN